ncbi:Candidapepsin-4 [Arthrobotrys entomopaga]|nr:Candidapepsin-4 [Arthrobotrys entomopaga]
MRSQPAAHALVSLALLSSLAAAGSILSERQAQAQYVVLPVKYNLTILGQLDGNLYSEVEFAPSGQKLLLGMNTDSVTWVPEQPASTAQFCSNETNTEGCQIAGAVSGYYKPESNVSKKTNFFYSYASGGDPELNCTGYWTENTVTVGGLDVDIQFGVAQSWNIFPSLGLGLWPTIPSQGNRPSFLAALVQQGKIAAQYLACYNLGDPVNGGSVLLGGVDLDKFTGKFTIWSNYDLPGIVSSPTIRYIRGSNITDAPVSHNPTALVNPFTPFFYLPDEILNDLVQALGAQFIVSLGAWGLPCGTQIDPTWMLEFTFSRLVISVPMSQLLSDVPSPNNLCFIALQPVSYYEVSGYNISYVIGGAFFRSAYVVVNPSDNTTAIAVANPNVTTQNIIGLGGPYGKPLDALNGTAPSPSQTSSATPPTTGSKKSNTGAIVGGVVGGIGGLALICAAVWFFLRSKKQKSGTNPATTTTGDHPPELPAAGAAAGHQVPHNELDGSAYVASPTGEIKKADVTSPNGGYYAELPHKQEYSNTYPAPDQNQTYELA